MNNLHVFAMLTACAFLATSCGVVSAEDKLATIVAETICVADSAYKNIENMRSNVENRSALQEQMREASTQLNTLMRESFSSEEEMVEAQNAVENKEALKQKAISIAKAKCSPAEKTIEDVTNDMNS